MHEIAAEAAIIQGVMRIGATRDVLDKDVRVRRTPGFDRDAEQVQSQFARAIKLNRCEAMKADGVGGTGKRWPLFNDDFPVQHGGTLPECHDVHPAAESSGAECRVEHIVLYID